MVNGLLVETSDKVKDDRYGLMGPCMRDGGKTIKQMEKDDLSMLMVTCMMDNGLMTKLMDLAYIAISMEQNMKATGKKINNMVMG